MKKLTITLAIVLGMTFVSFGDPGYTGERGLFERGHNSSDYANGNRTDPNYPLLPGALNGQHQDANDNAPVGSGIAVLLGLGGAYLLAKKRED